MSNETKELATRKDPIAVGERGLVLSTFDDMWRFANAVCASGLAARGDDPNKVLVKVQWGYELQIGPMQAIHGIAVIGNRPAVWGDLMLALAQRSPSFDAAQHHEFWSGEGDTLTANCKIARKGGNAVIGTFSIAQAKAAGLAGKDTYKAYGRDMLMWRARSRAYRAVFAAELRGLQVVEDMDERFVEKPSPSNATPNAARLAAAIDIPSAQATSGSIDRETGTFAGEIIDAEGGIEPDETDTCDPRVRSAIRSWCDSNGHPEPTDADCAAAGAKWLADTTKGKPTSPDDSRINWGKYLW